MSRNFEYCPLANQISTNLKLRILLWQNYYYYYYYYLHELPLKGTHRNERKDCEEAINVSQTISSGYLGGGFVCAPHKATLSVT
jgi:hypothetical protein